MFQAPPPGPGTLPLHKLPGEIMKNRSTTSETLIDRIDVSTYRVPTDSPEADGTLSWDHTTLVLVEAQAGGMTGLGYTYADQAAATLLRELLVPTVLGRDAMEIAGAWSAMVRQVRNLGRPGIASMAISAVDSALWDLKARRLGVPLFVLLGAVRDRIDVYGSGGFTSYSDAQLRDQLGGWVAEGIPRVKMKIGSHPDADRQRIRIAREAIGPTRSFSSTLMVPMTGNKRSRWPTM